MFATLRYDNIFGQFKFKIYNLSFVRDHDVPEVWLKDPQIEKKWSINIRGCQIGMQGPQLCAQPRHFCKLDVATSRIEFLDLNLHVLQVAPSNSKN